MTGAVKKAAGQGKSSAKKAVASESDDSDAQPLPTPEEVEAQAKSPYPADVTVYSYQPKDGGEPILLALNGYERPDKVWHFDNAQRPYLAQTWAWMEKALVPKDIQRQAQFLPDAEYFEMFNEWFAAMTAFNKNGPKGSLTAGK